MSSRSEILKSGNAAAASPHGGEALVHGAAAGIAFLRRPAHARPAATLVLLHGIGSNAASFAPLMHALSGTCEALAWNAPGYAESNAFPAARPVPEDYAAALGALLDALELRSVVLVGHSLGAIFAARFAAAHPERVAALALVSPALGYRVRPGGALPGGVQSRIDEIEALGPAAFAARRAPRLVHDPMHQPTVAAAVEHAMAAVHVAGYVQAVHALGAGDLLADAARITAPALVAVGAQDVITPPPNARAAHAAFAAAAAYEEIPAAGHALPQEQPRALAGILAQFAEQHGHV